ncbi:MAG: DUF4355 domain-containing protein [Candidatus Methanomethylophilaceae archaeon]
MTDEKIATETGSETKDPHDVKEYSKNDVNEMISSRVNELNAKWEREIAKLTKAQAEAERIASLQGEERVKAEYEAKLKETSDSLEQTRRELALSKAQAKLTSRGLPPEFADNVLGADDKETDSKIDLLAKTVSDLVAKQVSANLSHGTPPQGGNPPSEKDAIAARLDRVMGMKR